MQTDSGNILASHLHVGSATTRPTPGAVLQKQIVVLQKMKSHWQQSNLPNVPIYGFRFIDSLAAYIRHLAHSVYPSFCLFTEIAIAQPHFGACEDRCSLFACFACF